MASFQELRKKFMDLAAQPIESHLELFLKSFIFALGDNWKDVNRLANQFQKYLKDAGEGQPDLNAVQAADFLQKNGVERTASQRKQEVLDIDLDNNDRICFIEYLLLHFKAMILDEYYKRTKESCPFDLSNGAVGITGVGHQLLDELFTLPVGLDPELEKAIEEFTAKKKAKEAKVNELQNKAAQGGVKGLAAKNELEQLEQEDRTEMNRIEVTLNAAKKRAAKNSGEAALQEKKKLEEQEEKKKREESRQRLANMKSQWENK